MGWRGRGDSKVSYVKKRTIGVDGRKEENT